MTPRIFGLILFLCAGAVAQESAAYLFAAPGHTSSPGHATVQGGAGGELVWKYFGLGAELSYLAPQRSFLDGVGVVSLDPAVHVPLRRYSTIDPYLLGGYTVFFRNRTTNGGNYGGGVNWWFNNDFGLKLELRSQVVSGTQYWGFRVGLNIHID